MSATDKASATAPSRYHRFKQDDGKGFGILRLDAIGGNEATIVDANLTEDAARELLAAYRREEHAATSDDRPSIAALQMMHARDRFSDEAAIIDAAPVLLEIAAAALAYENSQCDRSDCDHPAHRYGCAIIKAGQAMRTALAKVRP